MPYGLVIMASKATEESQENTCVVCFKGVDIYSIGQCDHPVCYECSTRMRVLCRQNECPICRQDMPKVIFTKIVQPYNTLKHINGVIDKKFKIAFETEDEKKAYEALLAHECPKCSKVFTTFTYLRDHVRRVHQLNYCDLCVDNLKIYSRERRCYSRAELTRHRKDGDTDDRSHRGHPLCEFCDTRYMDNDELYRHLRRDHLFCHFCDADGLHQYYSSYDFLRDHFRSEHFLCEEGDCINEKFTAVFRTEIDLKAHKATVHGKGLGKAGLKQARTLELEFTLAPRPRPLHSRQPRHREEEVVPEQFGAAGGQVEDVNAKRAQAPELRREEDFPALGSEASGTSLSLRLTSAKQPSVSIHTSIQVNHPRFTTKVTSQNNYNYHFPALDNSTSGGDVAVTSVSWSACSGGPRGGRSHENKAGVGLPPPEAFPSLAVPAPRTGGASRTSTAVGTDSELTEHRPHQQQSHKQPPQSQPEIQQQPPSKSKKKKSKSGKNSESNSAATSSSSCLTSGESKLKKNKKDVKTSQNKQDHSQINNNIENNNNNNNVENIIKAMSIVSERQPLKPENNERQTKTTERDDFPSLSAPPGFPAMPPASAAPRWEVKKPPKPPPGLGKPPPGLPPPGFSGLNGGFPPLIGGPAGEDPAALTGYITPNNFAKRNSSLVKLINASLVGETLEEFKQISVAFRRGSLAAPEYYHHCKEMLGPANFRELFPELLALLPDIDKQQALWKLYKLEFNFLEGSKKKGSKLDVCVTCNQVLRTSDLREHLARHGGITTQVPAGSNQNNPWAKVNF